MWIVYLYLNIPYALGWLALKFCFFSGWLCCHFAQYLLCCASIAFVFNLRVHQVILALLALLALQAISLLPLVTLWDTMMMLWQIRYQSLLKMKQPQMTIIKQIQESMPHWSHWAARLRLCAAQMVQRNTQHGLVMTWSCATHRRRAVCINTPSPLCAIWCCLVSNLYLVTGKNK